MTWLRKTRDLFYSWRRRRDQRRAMAYLDDRELRDIGIDRLGAALEARKPFWKP